MAEPCTHENKELTSRIVSYRGYVPMNVAFVQGRWQVEVDSAQEEQWTDDESEWSDWLVCKDCHWVIARNPKVRWI